MWVALAFLSPLVAQEEPVVAKDTLSVHTVEHGDMPLRARATGSITSLRPPRAVVTLADESAESCKPGERASAQLDPPTVISGKVVDADNRKCEIEFSEPLSANAEIGKEVGALVDVGLLRDAVFFGRPADSAANSDGSVFVIEPGDEHARRVTVRYGQLSGALIQVLSGLSPGDRVIVTDMSKWIASPRVRLQ